MLRLGQKRMAAGGMWSCRGYIAAAPSRHPTFLPCTEHPPDPGCHPPATGSFGRTQEAFHPMHQRRSTGWRTLTTLAAFLLLLLAACSSGDGGDTGALMAQGKDTGVKLELRAGGPAIGFEKATTQLYADRKIHLAVANASDEVIQLSQTQPTQAVLAL